jgi:GNAT superfamily N-acetyltransferase
VLVHADETLIAGMSGYSAWGWLYVQWLWIAETHRGQGLAGRMLADAEAEARRRDCHGAYIDTFSPHALRVYQKAGYTVFGELKEFPPGRTRSFLSKVLA